MNSTGGKKSRKTGCLILIGLIGGIAVLRGPNDKKAVPTAVVDPIREAVANRDARDARTAAEGRVAITSMLRDPSSAEFGRIYATVRHGERVACGEVNGKNAFGAITGATPWLYRADKVQVMIRAYDNAGGFSAAWNKFCTGPSLEGLKAEPNDFVGIAMGVRPPAVLKPFNAAEQVWIFADGRAAAYLGVKVVEPTFMTDKGRIFGAQATASGRAAFDQLRLRMFDAYGLPTTDDRERPVVTWNWGPRKVLARLEYSAPHDQTTVSLTTQE